MERYEKYKDSGIEWIGDIPEHWDIKRLKYIGDSIIGMTYSPKEIVQKEGTLVLRSSNIQKGKLSLKDTVYINKDVPEKLVIRKGDILICSRNGSRRLIGKNITIDKRTEGETFGAFMTVFRTEQYKFISQYFNSQVFSGQSGLFLTATINQLTINTLNNFYTALPPKQEQTKIANYLDKKTSEIDELINQKETLLKHYAEEKTAIINQAVTKGINPKVKLKDSGVDWLGEIPEHWEVKRLKDVCKVRQGLQIPISKRVYTKIKNSYPYITIRAINKPDQITEYILDPSKNVICTKEDVIVARTGATGQIITNIEGVFHNNFFLADYNRNEVVKEYFVYFLKSGRINEYLLLVAGTTILPDLNHFDFYNTPYFEISKQEQTQIVNYI